MFHFWLCGMHNAIPIFWRIQQRPIGKQHPQQLVLENYNAHPLNKALVSQIDSLFDDIEVTIYMGTWCEDSQREVPGFFKIIDALEANDQVRPIVGLNEDKVSHDGSAEQAGVTNVPTFVLSKDGQEINRIVEFPIISLEQDILDILQDKGYKHAYDF